jgi:hypothetical protein
LYSVRKEEAYLTTSLTSLTSTSTSPKKAIIRQSQSPTTDEVLVDLAQRQIDLETEELDLTRKVANVGQNKMDYNKLKHSVHKSLINLRYTNIILYVPPILQQILISVDQPYAAPAQLPAVAVSTGHIVCILLDNFYNIV